LSLSFVGFGIKNAKKCVLPVQAMPLPDRLFPVQFKLESNNLDNVLTQWWWL